MVMTMASTKSFPLSFPLLSTLMILFLQPLVSSLFIEEATVQDLQTAFINKSLTSKQLVRYYRDQIFIQSPVLKAVVEINPDAMLQADAADRERAALAPGKSLGDLHGIPILLKDNIATKDKMNTTAGSLALVRSIVPRDAGVVEKLRKAGVIILGKTSLTEWANFRGLKMPGGWCARTGQGKNPYTSTSDTCGSSSGSAVSAAANLAAVTLGTETDGSILCPSSNQAVIGFKPTVGLTSRAGVIPITPRQDSVGTICRTVTDAVYVLDAIVGEDSNDEATIEASKYIPKGGYKQFLKIDGLKGKRLGLLREFFAFDNDPGLAEAFERHFSTLRERGAVLVEPSDISVFMEAINDIGKYEILAITAEFKIAINSYLQKLEVSSVRSLKDIIEFNNKNKNLEKIDEYGQELFLKAEATNGIGDAEKKALKEMENKTRYGFEKLMAENKLDAFLSPFDYASSILAIGQFPGIIVPAGYEDGGLPFGLCFGGLKGSEPTLIEIAYGFEQATNMRRPPAFRRSSY